MKFKILSMLVTLGFLSIMPMIYMGKLDPLSWLDFDAGAAYMFATLASVSLWNGTGSQRERLPPRNATR